MVVPGDALRRALVGCSRSTRGARPPELAPLGDRPSALIRDNGVTYNVYGDPQGADRPWELDPIPLLISARGMEPARERACAAGPAAEAVLADLYGPQRLLAGGIAAAVDRVRQSGVSCGRATACVPPDGFICTCTRSISRARRTARWVLADRTQAPSGAGYALENRIVLSRMLPEAVSANAVCSAGAVSSARSATRWRRWLRTGRDNPHVVLLTPGRYNETYFEHAYPRPVPRTTRWSKAPT